MSDLDHTKRVALSMLDAISAKNYDALDRALAEDLSYWVAGTTPLSGTTAKADFMKVFDAMRNTVDGPMVIHVDEVTAEEDRVCVVAHGNMQAGGGKPYNNFYHWFMRVRGDQVVEVREYLDTELLRSVLE
jgi:uncharacterized protein